MIVDSHCHLDRLSFDDMRPDLDAVMSHAREQGVGFMLCVAVSLSDMKNFSAIEQAYDNVVFSAGVHPLHELENEFKEKDLLDAVNGQKVVAVGETGLDFYYDSVPIEVQKERLAKHIRVAREVKKPLIIHTRNARQETLDILQCEKAEDVGGVLHCFTETVEMAKAAIEMGFYISFSGIVTFKRADELRNVVKSLPLERILVETDSPYLAPAPYRGKPCFPGYTKQVVEQIAATKSVSVESVIEQTTKNFEALFRVNLKTE